MESKTRLATRQIRLQQWAEIIRDRQASGMKINEYGIISRHVTSFIELNLKHII